MVKVTGNVLALLLMAATAMMGASCVSDVSVPPAAYGQLQVIGTQLSDEQGNPVQLKGMSTMGLQWYGGIVNRPAFTALVKDWGSDVIRLALYVGENGYATNPGLKDLVTEGVELAIDLGIYVIIDWHVLTPGNPNDPVYSGAEAFFDEMSRRYGHYPNVIYEIMNEPNGPVSWAQDLKPYAQRMVSVIRANDPDNIILIGSGTWSQDVDVAAADPVEGENLMYTVHFYSGTHGQGLREKVRTALSRGVAVFASEWGTSEASGNGGPYINAADEWLAFFDEHRISWANWSLANKNETSAAFKALLQEYVQDKGNVILQEETPLVPDVIGSGGYPVWGTNQLSVSGAYVRARIKGIDTPTYTTPIAAWDFESGGLDGWHVADDSGVTPELATGDAESRAIVFSQRWSGEPSNDPWATAPRLRIADTGLEIGDATELAFDLYLEAGKNISGMFEVNPILQYPPSWWDQLPAVEISYPDGEPVANGLVRFPVSVPLSLSGDTALAHLLLVIVGAGTGYEGRIYLDNIAVARRTNGDQSVPVAVVADEPGEFGGLPWDFDDGTRQGWVVTEDSPARVQLGLGEAESPALRFEYGWNSPGPEDPWNAAPRISSSWVALPAGDFTRLSLDFFIQEGAATTGTIQVQPVIQSPQHGYWFQLNATTINPSAGEHVGSGLLRHAITVPLTSTAGAELQPGAVVRNLILITVGIGTDYEGSVYYDNITFE
jgi:endoglucanase